jgi:pimeloyl-ACP methyl ester carboxylesterase
LTYFYSVEFYDNNPNLIQKAEDALINVHRPIEGFANMGHALIHHDTADLLHKIEVPTLLICGEDDMITPSAHTVEMGRKIKNSEVHIIPKTLHGVLSEKPETFNLITQFFIKN